MKSRVGPKADLRRHLAQAGLEVDLSERFYQQMVLSMNGDRHISWQSRRSVIEPCAR